MAKKKRRGLGTLGVDALLSSAKTVAVDSSVNHDQLGLKQIALADIEPSKHQPRQHMDQEALAALAKSIKAQGLIQPIVVKPKGTTGFELIAGERRWRAAQLAGLETIPAMVREMDDNTAAACALIENVQREDLNPLEQAAAMQKLITHFDFTHEQLAQTLGLSRPAVSNLLRLLKLDDRVAEMLIKKQLEMGHARAILGVEKTEQATVALTVIQKNMTVRQTEQYVDRLRENRTKKKHQAQPDVPAEIKQLQQQLSDTLNTPVSIEHHHSGSGKLHIRYANLDVLDGILKKIH